jgi:hypothetical protein
MKICPRCGAEHTKSGIYCSRSCANKRFGIKRKASQETIEKCRMRANEQWSNKDKRQNHSKIMKKVVLENPDSYSKSNVSGRVKMYDVESPFGPTKVKGTWERSVAEHLNNKGIHWTNNVNPIPYYWNDGWHLYFPDFYIVSNNTYIEVKGYKTDRDKAKWSYTTNLIVIEKEDMCRLEGKVS